MMNRGAKGKNFPKDPSVFWKKPATEEQVVANVIASAQAWKAALEADAKPSKKKKPRTVMRKE